MCKFLTICTQLFSLEQISIQIGEIRKIFKPEHVNT